jgi:hypothetical protein
VGDGEAVQGREGADVTGGATLRAVWGAGGREHSRRRVCRAHAIEFYTGLILFAAAAKRAKASEA